MFDDVQKRKVVYKIMKYMFEGLLKQICKNG